MAGFNNIVQLQAYDPAASVAGGFDRMQKTLQNAQLSRMAKQKQIHDIEAEKAAAGLAQDKYNLDATKNRQSHEETFLDTAGSTYAAWNDANPNADDTARKTFLTGLFQRAGAEGSPYANLIDKSDFDALETHFPQVHSEFLSRGKQALQRGSDGLGAGTTKGIQYLTHKDTGDTLAVGVIGGRAMNLTTNKPIAAEELANYVPQNIGHAANVTFSKQLGKGGGELVNKYYAEAEAGEDLIEQLTTLKNLPMDTDSLQPIKATMRGIANAFGATVNTRKLGLAEMFESLSNQASTTFYERTKGAISEREVEMFKTFIPRLKDSNAGRQYMADVMIAAAQRQVAVADFVSDLIEENNGKYPPNLRKQVSERFRDKPIVSRERIEEILENGDSASTTSAAPVETLDDDAYAASIEALKAAAGAK